MQQAIFIISIVLFGLYFFLLLYYRQSWVSLPDQNLKASANSHTRITVIIPARNEEATIRDCLESVCGQDYPKQLFEVLVVDDHSTDKTATYIREFENKQVKYLALKDFTGSGMLNSYKKKAIEIAIQQSSGDLIVTTDADCKVPPGWLQTIAAFYEQYDPAFIVMPVCYTRERNLLGIFQSLDFMTLQGITGAAVNKKMHSMCNGANLAYTRKAYEEAGGFSGIDHIASGDDMLLMHKIYRLYPDKILFLKSKAVIVHTRPMSTIRDFFNQRIRWASKADKYDDKRIFAVLLLVYLFNLWFLVLAIVALFNGAIAYCLITALIGKILLELFFQYPIARFFEQTGLLWWFPFAEPFHILYTIVAGGLGRLGHYHWKDRQVK